MYKDELRQKVAAVKEETRIAIQTVYDSLNQGQQNKLLKDESIAALFERYGVEV